MFELVSEIHERFVELNSDFINSKIKSGIAERQFRANSRKSYYGKNYITCTGNKLKCLQDKPDKSIKKSQ